MQYSQRFNTAFDRSVGHEGGFQCDPTDRGNWTSGKVGEGKCKGTKFGISAMTYPNLDIFNLTPEQAKEIYWRDWWKRFDLESYPIGLGFQLFDASLHHGLRSALKILQRAVAVDDDGYAGAITKRAVWSTEKNDLLLLFLAERLVFMTHCKTWDSYSKGWSRRIAQNLVLASEDN